MAIASMILDPNAQAYTDDEIVGKVNNATAQVTRAGAVSAAARPIGSGEVTSDKLDAGAAKANLDSMTDIARGYIKTAPVAGQFPVVSIERQADGKTKIDYDNVAV
jgi:hypothetical protein